MKFKLIVEHVYSVPDADLERIYSTTDPAECAAIDEQNSPSELLYLLPGETTHRIEPVPE